MILYKCMYLGETNRAQESPNVVSKAVAGADVSILLYHVQKYHPRSQIAMKLYRQHVLIFCILCVVTKVIGSSNYCAAAASGIHQW